MSAANSAKARGTKRKRTTDTKEDLQQTVIRKLHHDTREIKKAAKKAKTFETQKVVKKLKSIGQGKDKTTDDVTELQSMLEVVKLLDHEAVATTALKTKLTKDKSLASNEYIKAAITTELALPPLEPAPPGSPAAKMQARLLSSKVLSSEIAAVIRNMHTILNLDGHTKEETATGDSSPPKKTQKDAKASTSKTREKPQPVPAVQPDKESSDSEDEDVVVDDEGAGWESGSVGDDEQEAEDDGWESGSIAGDGEDDSVVENSSDEDEELRPQPPSKKRKTAPVPAATESTFLPSLSVGFVEGSDSEVSESELKHGDIAPKKNRRGQRARQAIWAKKFGKNANHKKKEQEEYEKRRERREARLKAQQERQQQRLERRGQVSFQPPQSSDSGWGHRGGPGRSESDKKGAVGSGELHPSWQAKKKLKETQSAAIIPASGKKITFD